MNGERQTVDREFHAKAQRRKEGKPSSELRGFAALREVLSGSSLAGMRSFGVICLGQSVSQLGTGLTSFALGVWVYQTTGSVTYFALITFFAVTPRIALLPLLGALVDRWDRRRAMIWSDTVSGGLTAILLVLFWLGRAEPWHILPIVSVASALAAIQQLAFNSSVALLVPKRHLGRANGMVQLGGSSAMVAAPLMAGALMEQIGVRGIMAIDLATLAFCIATFIAASIPSPVGHAESRTEEKKLLQEVLFGWRYIRSRSGLVGLLALFACTNFTLGMIQTLLTPMILSFSTTEMLGRVLFAASAGTLAGGLTMTFWGGPRTRTWGIFGFMALQGLVLCLGGLLARIPSVAVVAFAYMFCVPIINGCSMAIWQSKVAPAEQGKVFAAAQFAATLSMPLAYLAAGPLADHVFEPLLAPQGPLAGSLGQIIGVGPGRGIAFLFIVLGAGLVALTAAAFSKPALRRLERELPDAVPEPV